MARQDSKIARFYVLINSVLVFLLFALDVYSMEETPCKTSAQLIYKDKEANEALQKLSTLYNKVKKLGYVSESDVLRDQFYRSLTKFLEKYNEHSLREISVYLNRNFNSSTLKSSNKSLKAPSKTTTEFYEDAVVELPENESYLMKIPKLDFVIRASSENSNKSVVYHESKKTDLELEFTKMQASSKPVLLTDAFFFFSEESSLGYLVYRLGKKLYKLEHKLNPSYKILFQSNERLTILSAENKLLDFKRTKMKTWNLTEKHLNLGGKGRELKSLDVEFMANKTGLLHYKEEGIKTTKKTAMFSLGTNGFEIFDSVWIEATEFHGKFLFISSGFVNETEVQNSSLTKKTQKLIFESKDGHWIEHKLPAESIPDTIVASVALDKNNLIVLDQESRLFHYAVENSKLHLVSLSEKLFSSIKKISEELYLLSDNNSKQYFLSLKEKALKIDEAKEDYSKATFTPLDSRFILANFEGERLSLLKISQKQILEEVFKLPEQYLNQAFSAQVLLDRWVLFLKPTGEAVYLFDLKEESKGLQILKDDMHLFEPIEGGGGAYFVAIGKKQGQSSLFHFTDSGVYKFDFDENNFDNGQSRTYTYLLSPEGVEFKGKYILKRDDSRFEKDFQ